MMAKIHPLVSFYEGSGTDSGGRTLTDVQSLTFAELESLHDYIQWLFPLEEHSMYNSFAPILDAGAIAEFKSRPEVQGALERSFQVMLHFYGFIGTSSADGYAVTTGPNFSARSRQWLTSGNHNFLRLTRILKSLCLLGRRDCAVALFGCLKAQYAIHYRTIGERTFSYWIDALA